MSKSAITLVFIHGFAANQTVWGECLDHFAKQYPVNAIDLPGYGESKNITAHTLHQIACAVRDTCPTPALWIGWSFGAHVARYLAKLVPDHTKGLITFCSNPKFVASPDWPGISPIAFNTLYDLFSVHPDKALTRFFTLQGVELNKDIRGRLLSLKKHAEQLNPDILLRDLTILRDTDLRDNCSLSIRELNIFGRQDRLVPIAVAERLKDLSAHAQSATIYGATHVPFLSHLSECLTHMDPFIHDILTHR
ncbi:MAG TPA: alpha/beta fold hydrolase [Gammaproteobacteria bacterium]|nr:alpha/beta fold hydrolase [Gammaproteobacteria bacterium]